MGGRRLFGAILLESLRGKRDREHGLGKTLGYARISTNEGQDVASQKAMLEELGAVVVFTDTGNGSSLVGRD